MGKLSLIYKTLAVIVLGLMWFRTEARAQDHVYQWTKTVGGMGNDYASSVAVDGSGNVYLVGDFQAYVDFDAGAGTDSRMSAGNNDAFLSKYDASGKYEWTKTFGGSNSTPSLNSVAVDVSGNVYVAGYFNGTVDFDPGAGSDSRTSAGNDDAFLSKYDASGKYEWTKAFGGTKWDSVSTVAIDGSGHVYVGGRFEGTVDFDPGSGDRIDSRTSAGSYDAFLSKYDASGKYEWTKAFGGTKWDSASSVAIDGSGNVYVGGRFEGTVDFDPGSGDRIDSRTSAGSYDAFLSKYDSLGNYEWTKAFGGTEDDWNKPAASTSSVAVDVSGNVYVAGSFTDLVDFDPGSGNDELVAYGDDAFLSKYDALGNYEWTKTVGGLGIDGASSVAVDGLGNVYVAGSFSKVWVTGPSLLDLSVDFDPGAGTDNRTSLGSYDIFLSKYDALGNYEWTKTFGGLASDWPDSVAVDGSGNAYVAGRFIGIVDFDPGAGTDNRTSTGHDYMGTFDAFLSKYRTTYPSTLSGTVTADGSPLSGVTVRGSGTLVPKTTDSEGRYSFSEIPDGESYMLTPSKPGYTFRPTSASGTLNGNSTENFTATATVATYTIAGTVTLAGVPLSGVTVKSSGGLGSKTTNSLGQYSFAGVLHGTSYTLTPSKAGYIFSPTSVSGTLTGNATENFAAHAAGTTYTIAGTVTVGGVPMSGVTVKSSGALGSKTTNSLGQYSFTGVPPGTSYTLTPSELGYTFSPTSVSGTLIGNATENFTATWTGTTYAIAGTVTVGGSPLPGVTVQGSGALGSKTTNFAGQYSFTGISDGTNYTLTPSKSGYTFSPTSASVTLTGNATENFTATATVTTYTISGTVTAGSSPLSGVTVMGNGTLGSQTTDESGHYSFTGVPHGTSYTLTPSKTGYTFSPTSASGTCTGNATHDFVATLDSHTISGTITAGGNPLSGVTVTGSGALGSQTTDGSGNYSFTGVASGTGYTLTPSKTGYVFSPTIANGTLTANATANFTATLKDTDGDGLPDLDEAKHGSSPAKADTDGDGISDGQEITDGTNPNDSGSVAQVLGTTLCSEWNGFLGLTNIAEHVNLGSSTIQLKSTLYSISGATLSEKSISVKSGSQFDLIVNDMPGFAANSYGKICSTLTKGKAGDLDGRMVYYKTGDAEGYQFAFAMPFSNGLAGRQYVQFDTLPYSKNNFTITNWLQITNLGKKAQTGKLTFYSDSGKALKTQTVKVNGGGRTDISAHQFGASKTGLAEWIPSSGTGRFQIRNVRYYYDNATDQASFETAFQYEGVKGSGEQLVVPYDTTNTLGNLLISNTTDSAVSATVQVYLPDGKLAQKKTLSLKAHATSILGINGSSAIFPTGKGIVTIDGNKAGSIVASLTQPSWTETGNIQNMYGNYATQPLGSVLKGSYNTFIGQGCRLLLANPTAKKVTAALSMSNYKRTQPLKGKQVSVPAHGLVEYNLCSKDQSDVYGVVTVQPATPNTVSANVLRVGENEQYRFPTPVRE